jgi:hypothetical protein
MPHKEPASAKNLLQLLLINILVGEYAAIEKPFFRVDQILVCTDHPMPPFGNLSAITDG